MTYARCFRPAIIKHGNYKVAARNGRGLGYFETLKEAKDYASLSDGRIVLKWSDSKGRYTGA